MRKHAIYNKSRKASPSDFLCFCVMLFSLLSYSFYKLLDSNLLLLAAGHILYGD